MDDETVLAASPEDPVVVLGSGMLGWTGDERRTDRYGTVHLTVMDSIPGELAPPRTVPVPQQDDLAARIVRELAKGNPGLADAAAAMSEAAARRPDNRFVAFDHAPLGTAGTLVAHVIHADVSDDDREFGRRHPELRPPVPGELKAAADRYGLTVTAELAHDFNPVTGKRDGKVIDATVTVEGRFKRGDAQACIATLTNAGTVLGMVRMIRPGSVWGTPETVAEQMTGGRVRMSKSGAEIAVARRLTPAKAAKPEPSIPRRQRPRQHVLPQTRGRSR